MKGSKSLVAFLNNLSLTVPRTHLEKFHGADVMGYYASVSSPTMVIQLAAVTLFAPLVPIITERFLEVERLQFELTALLNDSDILCKLRSGRMFVE